MDKRELENDIITELNKSKYGKKDQPRAIMYKLLSYKDKAKVLQNCNKRHMHKRRFFSSYIALQKRALERGKYKYKKYK